MSFGIVTMEFGYSVSQICGVEQASIVREIATS